MNCPLCQSKNISNYSKDQKRQYFHCLICDLVFVVDKDILSEEEEMNFYLNHENQSEDKGYRQFLSMLADPLLKILPRDSIGLDFGSGPGPTLGKILEEKKMKVSNFDKFFCNNPEVLKENYYDFITSTEVFEHIKDLEFTIKLFKKMIRINGVIGLMTKLRPSQNEFSNWYYKLDPTHIRFFSHKTMNYLGDYWQKEVKIINDNVILFK